MAHGTRRQSVLIKTAHFQIGNALVQALAQIHLQIGTRSGFKTSDQV
jgi:hypothetical protein